MTTPSEKIPAPDDSEPPDTRTGAVPPSLAGPTGMPHQRTCRPRTGRPLGPVACDADSAHRAWLIPVREAYLASGLTMVQLGMRLHLAKSKISELLSGRTYPRWETLYKLAVELQIPYSPLYRLWRQAALEGMNKNPQWVQKSTAGVTLTTNPAPPLDHRAFCNLTQDGYRTYAGVFLSEDDTRTAIRDTFDQLWLSWNKALSSPDARRYAWHVLRSTVMSRTPHLDGRPEFQHAAFSTVALQSLTDQDACLEQLAETLALLKAMRRLPDNQLDVVVLRSLCGISSEDVSELLGVPLATVRSDERHATRFLDSVLCPSPDYEGNLA
ncbi:sigma factor-like helix-turn-helix DNA-binding protein [Streptomyces sp. MMBL 11-3]|uniref:sigma factor-like helix-turn-helix DNA-binding protein n=1 Tax=Streptomyces sp. MMBL 11-3 TaxID=3382639 RepID=UPI0039B61773